MKTKIEPQWYVQKGARIQGPFSEADIGQYLLLGRIKNTDKISIDRNLWEPATQLSHLMPDEFLNGSNIKKIWNWESIPA